MSHPASKSSIRNLIETHMQRIGVVQLGGPEWPRFAPHDERYRYWTGAGWEDGLRHALLFADEASTAAEYQRVVRLLRAGQPVRVYTARVTVKVVGDEQYTPARLRRYLSTACRLHLDPDRLDDPAPDADVAIEIEWADLEEHDQSTGAA